MAVPGQSSDNPFPNNGAAPDGSGGDLFKFLRQQGDRAASQVRSMPTGVPQPQTTVRKGAMQVGRRPPPAAPPTPGTPMNMGDYDNGMGGIFGEAEQEGRGLSVDALGLARSAATGATPSAAAILGQQGLDRAAAEQASLAASARGPAALAMAQQGAAYNTAAMQQQGAAQMAAQRAQEMDMARQRYLEGTGLLRGQDQSRYAQELQRGTSQAGLESDNQRNRAGFDVQKGQVGMDMFNQGVGLGRWVQDGTEGAADRMYGDEQAWRNATAAKDAADAKARGDFYRWGGEKAFGAVNQAAASAGGSSNSATKAQSQAEASGAQDGAGSTKSGNGNK